MSEIFTSGGSRSKISSTDSFDTQGGERLTPGQNSERAEQREKQKLKGVLLGCCISPIHQHKKRRAMQQPFIFYSFMSVSLCGLLLEYVFLLTFVGSQHSAQGHMSEAASKL